MKKKRLLFGDGRVGFRVGSWPLVGKLVIRKFEKIKKKR